MGININKLKNLSGYFIIGIVSILYSFYTISAIRDNYKESDFVSIDGKIFKPIEHRGEGKGTKPYLYFRISKYPDSSFSSNDPELLKNEQKIFDSISIGNATSLGDSVNFVISREDFNFIQKSSTQDLYGKDFEILGVSKGHLIFLAFNLEQLNIENNSARKAGFIFGT